MKRRLFACIAVAVLVIGASAASTRFALARGGQEGQDQKGEDRGRSGDKDADPDKVLKAFDERMGKNLDKCREELGQLKKDLHELIDMHFSMAMALAELRARNPMPGAAGVPHRKDDGPYTGQPAEGVSEHAALGRALQQIHNQLRSQIEQEQNQVAQLAAQLRAMKGQHGQRQGAGDEARKAPATQAKPSFDDLPAKK